MNEYKSPIEIAIETIHKEINDKEDNAILQVVQNVGVNVDKYELIKALKYDREQYDNGYNKGFFDGYEKGKQETAKEILQEVKAFLDTQTKTVDSLSNSKSRYAIPESCNECYKGSQENRIAEIKRIAEKYGVEVEE